MKLTRALICGLAGLMFGLAASAAESDLFTLPIAVKKLENGLTVVVSEDRSAPVVGISLVYKVGMRSEPRNRTGFAHLFEHLMFEGTPNAPEGTFDKVISGGGGRNNGSTRADFTNYVAIAPVSALEPILWLEADRMSTLNFNPETLKNQQDVVKEEIRVNVKNQPYGGFMWLDINQQAFDKWENNHDGYGSFVDLENANLDDVRAFHRDYYGPNNAILSLAGDLSPEQGFALAEKYFGKVAARPTPKRGDVDEPLNTKERRSTQSDALAQVPAVAMGYKIAPRGSKDQAPLAVLAEVLAGGDASRLYQGLVKGKEQALNIDFLFGITGPFEFDGPTLLTLFALYKPNVQADQLIAEIDSVVANIVKNGVPEAELARIKTAMRADWNNSLESFLSRADTLAKYQALWGDAKVVNQVPGWIDAVTSADLQRVAAKYLVAENRTVIDRKPAAMLATDPAKQ